LDLSDFIKAIPRFSSLAYAEKIKIFAWYLHRHRGLVTISPSSVSACFDELVLEKPTAITPFFTSIIKRRPGVMLRRGSEYSLERRVLDEYDKRYGQRETTVAVDRLLTALSDSLADGVEKAYLDEALVCFRHGAFRASIVMTWNLAYDHLCQYTLSKHLSDFNAQLPKTCPKADISSVSKRDDFTELKESQVLQVCKSANIVTSSLHKVLKEKLDKRNIAAHPSGISMSRLTAEEYISDLTKNVLLKLR